MTTKDRSCDLELHGDELIEYGSLFCCDTRVRDWHDLDKAPCLLLMVQPTDTFVVIEKWESADALKAQAAAPHMAAYAAKTKDMIANRVIHVLSPA